MKLTLGELNALKRRQLKATESVIQPQEQAINAFDTLKEELQRANEEANELKRESPIDILQSQDYFPAGMSVLTHVPETYGHNNVDSEGAPDPAKRNRKRPSAYEHSVNVKAAALASTIHKLKRQHRQDSAESRAKEKAEEIISAFKAGATGENKTAENIRAFENRMKSLLENPGRSSFTRDQHIERLDIKEMVQLYERVRDEFLENKSEELAFALGKLDALVTSKWKDAIRSHLEEIGKTVRQKMQSCNAIEVDSSSHHFMKFRDYARLGDADRTTFINVMALAEIHGDPRFVSEQLRKLSDPEVEQSTEQFFEALKDFGEYELADARVLGTETLKLSAVEKQKVEAKSQLARDKVDIVKPVHRLHDQPLAGSSQDTEQSAGSVADGSVSSEFSLAAVMTDLRVQDSSATYRITAARGSNSDEQVSFLIGRKNVNDKPQYFFYDPEFGRAAFNDVNDLERYIGKHTKHFVVSRKGKERADATQDVAMLFTVDRINTEVAQRLGDSKGLDYNVPHRNTPVADWFVPSSPSQPLGTRRSFWTLKTPAPTEMKEYSHQFLFVMENDQTCLDAAMNLYRKHPGQTSVIQWNPSDGSCRCVVGAEKAIDFDARVRLIGRDRSTSPLQKASPNDFMRTDPAASKGNLPKLTITTSGPNEPTERPADSSKPLVNTIRTSESGIGQGELQPHYRLPSGDSSLQQPSHSRKPSASTLGTTESDRQMVTIKTVAGHTAADLGNAFVDLIHQQRWVQQGENNSPQCPKKINLVTFNNVAGGESIETFGREFVKTLLSKGFTPMVSVIRGRHEVTEKGRKISDGRKASGVKTTFEVKDGDVRGTSPPIPGKVKVVDLEAQQIIVTPQDRSNKTLIVVNVGKEISNFKAGALVDVQRKDGVNTVVPGRPQLHESSKKGSHRR